MVTSLMGVLGVVAALAAAPGVPEAPKPPFAAWTIPGLVYVRHQPKVPSELAGALRRGDIVQVKSIVSDAEGLHPWALIDGDGAVPLAALQSTGERPDAAKVQASDATFAYARVKTYKAPVYAAADAKSAVRGHQKATYLLAFVPDDALLATGWLHHASGGFMRLQDVQLLPPSTFAGEEKPALPLAFVRRKVEGKPIAGQSPHIWQRYDRAPLQAEKAGRVTLKGTTFSRQLVRVAYPHARPKEIPKHAKWLHVDLTEQTLVAYDGDTPVFATMVSAGRDPHPTKKGVFRIYAKTVHSTMRGRGWADYVAEEVPWVMHFFQGQALHGSYWHDQFGIVKSHGCINLSFADAKFVFEWMAPPLPPGWHTLLPGRGDPAVYIDIDRGGDRPHAAPQPNVPTQTHQWTIDHQGAKKVRLDRVKD